jgi:hypothetical protein
MLVVCDIFRCSSNIDVLFRCSMFSTSMLPFTNIDTSLSNVYCKRSFFSYATIRQTRKFFPKTELPLDSTLKITESAGVLSGEIGISKWKDRGKKSVCVISTMHNPLENSLLRTQKDGSRKQVSCPVSISDYNKYMGGVYRFDQLHSAYNIEWKT